MRSGRLIAAAGVFFVLIIPLRLEAEIVEVSHGTYGNGFKDQATGLVWLDVRNFYSLTPASIEASLSGTPFRLATRAEIEQLSVSIEMSWLEIGGACSLNRFCYAIGIFDDSASGQNPSMLGNAYIDYTMYCPPLSGATCGRSVSITNDATAMTEAAQGAWVVQKFRTSCQRSPNTSDFDCDGKDEKIVWRNESGTWYLRLSADNGVLREQWGLPGDYPFMGDYDGDGVADLVVWRPSEGNWYVKTSSSVYNPSQAITQQFGLPGDVPMRGDYDSDGILDFAVWRPHEGKWYVLESSNHQAVVEQWGLPGDVPVIGGRHAAE